MVDDLENPADIAGDVKTTVHTSKFGSQVLERLIDSRYFPDNQMGLRFAIAIAVSRGIILPEGYKISYKDGLSWGTTGADPHGQLRIFIEEIYLKGQQKTHKEVYKIAEGLAEEGLKILNEKMDSGETISQWLD
jgi:hypothetical protein